MLLVIPAGTGAGHVPPWRAVHFTAALFLVVALWFCAARRRGLYDRTVTRVFCTEALQVAAIMIPAAVGGALAWLVAAILAALCTREWLPALRRAWPQGSLLRTLAVCLPACGAASYGCIASRPDGLAWILIFYGATEVHDVAAWLVGRTLGRHPVAPRLSPGKTWEGQGAGVAASLLYTGLALPHLLGAARLPLLGLGTVACAVGIGGDLLTSWVKRRAGLKDFAIWVPTQGGALDLYDSLLAVTPPAALWLWTH